MRGLLWTLANTKNSNVKFALLQTCGVGLGILTRVGDQICLGGSGSSMKDVPMVRGVSLGEIAVLTASAMTGKVMQEDWLN